MKMLSVVFSLILVVLAAGCSKGESDAKTSQQFSFDGVKLISPAIAKNNDSSSTGQGSYQLSTDRRLLIRFESLSQHVGGISVNEKNRVEAQVTVTGDTDATAARSALKVCPILKQWMMLATWDYGHPFGDDGKWSQGGGDFDGEGCVRATKEDAAIKTLTFDVSRWFTDYVRGRSQNYGLVVVAATPVVVLGENSGANSPRITFSE
ncbi:MAG: hypothetical protein HY074_20055 [Deltaproteobacteria bacterium]|nr:hypothetical protein [Deltaproteobacteria bacterium]